MINKQNIQTSNIYLNDHKKLPRCNHDTTYVTAMPSFICEFKIGWLTN